MKTAREKASRVKGVKSALVRGCDISVRKGKKSHSTCAFSAKSEIAKHGNFFPSLAYNNTYTLARCTHGTMKIHAASSLNLNGISTAARG